MNETRESSLCDRLKQRYGSFQQDWQSLFNIQENNKYDFELIQYIVNFIIEQAKYHIVLSELPDVIRTLHCQADAILQKNPMITLEEVITQVQMAGALKYPYLTKIKPITTEDFIREVLREVFDRLGTIITLDRIENICQFTSCSAKQLLQTMPTIDVNQAATLIIEDISRNQPEIIKNSKLSDVMPKTILHSSIKGQEMNKKSDVIRASINREQTKPAYELSRSMQRSKLAQSKELPENLFIPHPSLKNVNMNQQNEFENHLNLMKKSFNRIRRHKSMKKSSLPSIVKSSDTLSMKEHPENKIVVNDHMKNWNEKIQNQLTVSNKSLINQNNHDNFNLCKSKSNTQTYSIHSEEDLSMQTRKHSTQLNSTVSYDIFSSQTRPFILKTMHDSTPKEIQSFQSIHHYSKYSYQSFNIDNHNKDQISDIDSEICPLEHTVNRRFLTPI